MYFTEHSLCLPVFILAFMFFLLVDWSGNQQQALHSLSKYNWHYFFAQTEGFVMMNITIYNLGGP
jgi:hypothetical protein